MSADTITRTLSRRTFAGTVTGSHGHRDPHGAFGAVVSGPVTVVVEVTQSRRADGVECWPNYSVKVDGWHRMGGCADHLPADGIPTSSWLTIGSELEAEHTDLDDVDAVLAEMSSYAAGRLRDVVEAIRARVDGDTVNAGELVVVRAGNGGAWVGVATGDVDAAGTDDEVAVAEHVVTFDAVGDVTANHPHAELATRKRIADAGERGYWAGRYADELEAHADELKRRQLELDAALAGTAGNVAAARRAERIGAGR